MAELKSYESNLEELKSIYTLLHDNFIEVFNNKSPSSSKQDLLHQIKLLKENASKLESNILSLAQTQLIKEPSNIEGPVAYLYVEGDPGDSITRKIMLLGDVHTKAKPCLGDSNNVSIANFFRFTAAKLKTKSPKIIDVFIEEMFGGRHSSAISMAGNAFYLNKLITDFDPCLKVDKSQCKEPMRIHYADVRHIVKYKQSLENIQGFFKTIKFSSDRALLTDFLNNQPEWDSPEEIERLTHKIEQIKETRQAKTITVRLPNSPKQKTQDFTTTRLPTSPKQKTQEITTTRLSTSPKQKTQELTTTRLPTSPRQKTQEEVIRLPNSSKQKTQEETKELQQEEEYEDDPEEEEEGKQVRLDDANDLFDSYRLNDKRLNVIDPKVRQKVNRYIIQPAFNELYLFLTNRRNRVTYDLIKTSVRKCLQFDLAISESIIHLTKWLSSRLVKVTNAIMEAYFIVRMLKRAGNGIPPRPEVALRKGEAMTHIMAYFGYGHIFNLEKQLTKLGFRVLHSYESEANLTRIKRSGISNYHQCIPYPIIREAVDRFCK